MTNRILLWVEHKARLIDALAKGEYEGTYADACLIASSVISGLASLLWPGDDQIDRRRFVQVWQKCSLASPGINLISVPILIEHLEQDGKYAEAESLRASNPSAFNFGNSCRVLTSADVDLEEDSIQALCPSLTMKYIRVQSYANIFYRYVRSAYVHEYRIADYANAYPMACSGSGISYVNLTVAPYRRIHFEALWIINLLKLIATKFEAELLSPPINRPPKWWFDEA
ncbi:hypothetical protein [Altericista sp. CCNU0014]|uniref:hypothetical protein n=1 Tax=Altericista sp. CCNU0014 TaxID=3082949 RepID=UPI00384D4D64